MTTYVVWLRRKTDAAESTVLISSSEPPEIVAETASRFWTDVEGKVWELGPQVLEFERVATFRQVEP